MHRMLYVYKSMLNKLQNEWRSPIIFILFIIMIGALFVSRALLSLSMILFVLVSFFHTRLKDQLKTFFSTPLLWGMSLLFGLALLSGLWSEDKPQWLDIVRIKLPLLVLPLAFAGPFSFSKKQWEWLAFIFIGVVIAASAWSLFHYAADMEAINKTYLQAKTMITPLENDHVRFSWLVTVALLLSGWLSWQYRKDRGLVWWWLIIAAAWFITYLHVLAARTGLFSFYIIVLGIAVWLIVTKTKWLSALALLLVLIVLPIAAYFIFPSFQNRVKFIRHDFTYFKDAHYLPGATDAIRVISLKAGWNIMNKNPVKGVGFGDVMKETNKQYATHYPQMLETDRILPGSEWLLYGSACGWPGFILFTFSMMIPFFIPVKTKGVWWILNAIAAFSFLFDIGLEVQFGVFVYAFIILWFWKWLIVE